MKKIRFSVHAEVKFDVLRVHGIYLSRRKVRKTVQFPKKIEKGYAGRVVAQSSLDDTHVLRVVYEERENEIRIITFYPGRRERYENSI